MSSEDIRRLKHPKGEYFPPEIWAVVRYAEQWALKRGNIANPEVIGELEKYYSPEEREAIDAVIRIMDFSNKLNNLYSKPLET